MIFGLAEADNEDLHSKTLEVFEELNEKPFFKAERLGKWGGRWRTVGKQRIRKTL